MPANRRTLLLLVGGVCVATAATILVMRTGAQAERNTQTGATVATRDAAAASHQQRLPVPQQHQTQATRPSGSATAGTAAAPAQPGGEQHAKGSNVTIEAMSEHLRRNLERAAAQEEADRITSGAPKAPADPVATTPEQATPDRPWPPRSLPVQHIDKSLLTPQPMPRKKRTDDVIPPAGHSVQILPGNPG